MSYFSKVIKYEFIFNIAPTLQPMIIQPHIQNLDIFMQYLTPAGVCNEYFNTPISVRWLAEGGWVYKNYH